MTSVRFREEEKQKYKKVASRMGITFSSYVKTACGLYYMVLLRTVEESARNSVRLVNEAREGEDSRWQFFDMEAVERLKKLFGLPRED